MHITVDFETIEQKVENILKCYPITRGSDRYLTEKYLEFYHGITTFHDYSMSTVAPSLESIRRLRQKIQSAGKYLPSSEVMDDREHIEHQFRNHMRCA